MFITKVLSYKNSWKEFSSLNQSELDDLLIALPAFIRDYLASRDKNVGPFYREIWDKKLFERNWQILERTFYTEAGLRINVGNIGPIKNNVCASISFGSLDSLNRWLFQQSTIACKFNIAKIPILLVPVQDFASRFGDRFFSRFTFEMYQRQLEPLIPMSHAYPFLILGYSDQDSLFDLDVFEIESDPLVQNENIVVDRCIEFPPEYYHAGINILSFFGTYIKEQYPTEEANVKIEQLGNVVRLVIETKDGKTEIIEKALEEYQLIVSGKKTPESFALNEKLVLELKNELRIAKYRIESQQDIIQFQNNRIDKLLDILGTGLATKPSLSIDFHPSISASCNVTINQNISSAIGNLSELKDLLPKDDANLLNINDLEGSLLAIEKEQDPEIVNKSPAMSKFKRFLDKVSDGSTDLSKAIKSVETGWDIFKDLAGKYNSIAQWCGLPQVPTIFTK